MKVSSWLGIIAITTGMCSLVACSDDGDDATTDGGGATGGTGATGGSAGATGGAAGAAGSCSAGAADCDACLEGCCKDEGEACGADTDCGAIAVCYENNCFAADAGATCVADCIAANQAGGALFQAYLACAATNCLALCQ